MRFDKSFRIHIVNKKEWMSELLSFSPCFPGSVQTKYLGVIQSFSSSTNK